MEVSIVPTEYVDQCWDRVKVHLEKAVEYTYGRFTLEDIYISVKEDNHTLWVAFDDEGVKGAVVTNFTSYPRKKFVHLAFIGGVEGHNWKEPMLEILTRWAYDNNCNGLESVGRPGWAKIFKNYGYKLVGYAYEIPAADSGIGERNGKQQQQTK
jgi:hypothetical protein